MPVIRVALIAAVLMFGYAVGIVVAKVQYGWLLPVVLVALLLTRRAKQALSAYGSARWANSSDMKGMLDE